MRLPPHIFRLTAKTLLSSPPNFLIQPHPLSSGCVAASAALTPMLGIAPQREAGERYEPPPGWSRFLRGATIAWGGRLVFSKRSGAKRSSLRTLGASLMDWVFFIHILPHPRASPLGASFTQFSIVDLLSNRQSWKTRKVIRLTSRTRLQRARGSIRVFLFFSFRF
jgi:hypothetical protein